MAGLLSFLLSCTGQTKDKKQNIDINSDRFKVGQVWKFDNRIGEDSATLTILKIEKYEKGDTIIHIRVDGVKMYNPKVASGYSNDIGHLPFSQKSIEKSVTKLVGQKDRLPDFSEGYSQWKEAWDNGKGGYWTVKIKEAIEGVDSIMRQNK